MSLREWLFGNLEEQEEEHYNQQREPRDHVRVLEIPAKPDGEIWKDHSVGSWMPPQQRRKYLQELSK